MRSLFRTTDRSPANATLAVAFALALTAVCVTPEARAGSLMRNPEARTRLVDDQAVRIVAAAVNAARDLFGLDHATTVFLVPGRTGGLTPTVHQTAPVNRSETRPSGLLTLLPAFIDLPPPTC